MARRLELQDELQTLIGVREDGKPNVYYQPPESVKLNYPCFVYSLSNIYRVSADNMSYLDTNAYQVILITKDPDDPLTEKVMKSFSMCRFNRHYTASNLNHEAFTIYY